MPRWPLPILALLALLAGCATAPAPAPDADAPNRDLPPGALAAIRFVLRRDLPVARALVNGTDVGFFLIDTGSAISVVDQAVARQLNLPQGEPLVVTGIGGAKQVRLAKLARLQVDGFDAGAVQAAVVDLAAFNRSAGWPVAGILGFDLLQARPWTLDYQEGRITFFDPARFAGPPGAAAESLGRLQELPAVQVVIAGQEPLWVQLDTGCNAATTLPYPYIRAHPELLAGKINLHTQAYGVGGMGRSVNSTLDRVSVFGQELRDVPVQVELPDPATGGGAPLVGRLGNRVLRRFVLTLDAPHSRVWAVEAAPH